MIKHAGILAFALTATIAHAQDVRWLTDEKSAFARAKAVHQILMIDVFSESDKLSKRFDEGTLHDPAVLALCKQLVPFKCNPTMKDARAMAIKYGVNVFPTVVFVSANGQVVSKLVGYETGSDFASTMQVALDSAKEFEEVKKKLEAHPNDGEANAKFATFLSALADPTSGKPPAGAPYLEKTLTSTYHGPYLLRALEAVGDAYSSIPGKEPKAMACYQRALSLAKSPAQKTTAMIGIMYLQIDSDKKAAQATALRIINLKDAPAEWVYTAKEEMQRMTKG